MTRDLRKYAKQTNVRLGLTTMSAGATGEFQFEDTDAANHTQRFYRLTLP